MAEALSWPVILKKNRRWELVELYVGSHYRPSRHRQGQLHFYLFSLCSLTCLYDLFYLSAPDTNWNLCCSVLGLLDNSFSMDKPKCETSSHKSEINAVKVGSVRAGWVHQSDSNTTIIHLFISRMYHAIIIYLHKPIFITSHTLHTDCLL